jgi:hypothetical protein
LDWYSAPEPLSSSEMRFIIPSDPTELIRSDFRALFEVSNGILLGFSSAFVKTRYAHPYFHFVFNLCFCAREVSWRVGWPLLLFNLTVPIQGSYRSSKLLLTIVCQRH